ncbi:hypothetical protein KPL78_01030 [Roseomonas sp. HJA6]|uniref:YrhK domain-containing protein n=1 Tax=Roseomonas alba TaxID=2846776 RepID=A0ABS7A283_9PROT|nr:hypothetical protein [Neoroseomonas alba]MBW6396404.1 hypothetical protein [Neoroseomonas alba]
MTDRTVQGGGMHMRIEGPWPFITHRSYVVAGRHIEWLAREHRKGLRFAARALDAGTPPFWQGSRYNWSIGAIFAVGAFLFMLGSVMSLIPAGPSQPSAFWTNIVFFLGSIPFTIAAYLQHFQAANARAFTVDPVTPHTRHLSLIGWHPRSAGWLSTFTQFVGTVAFNASTFNAVVAPPTWYVQDVTVWAPDVVGSVLFLVSGYLAYLEAGHRYWSWRPRDLSWQIVFVNLIGCIAFMTAAILAYDPNGSEPAWVMPVSIVHLLIGAACFFVGALLSMQESACEGG